MKSSKSPFTTPLKYSKQDDGQAIPMVNYDMTTSKFIINPDAQNFLKTLQNPIGIISVAGMYRTGKSYLLNRMLLNRSGGFSVGPSINPCTKGLWMWNKTIAAHSPDGQPINVIIIDTEGIGATDEDHNHDNKIMTLAILLSSYFLFNSLGTIDENAIQNLSIIVNITKNIQQKNGNKDFALYLPSFMWVIRDFSLQLKNLDGQPITSKEYLERSLELQKGNSEFIKSKNQIRSLVKEYFKDRNCVTLVRPLTEEGNLQNLEKVDSSKLRKEFIDQVAYLRKVVLNSIKPKILNNQQLNGEMLVNLINSYVDMINKGAVPHIQSAWTYMCQNECTRALENSLELYAKKMNEVENTKLPMLEKDLLLLHKNFKKLALDNYKSMALGDFGNDKINKLKNDIKEIKKKCFEKNINLTKEKVDLFMEENFKKIDQNVCDNSYQDINEYKNDIEQFVQFCLNDSPKGPLYDKYIYENVICRVLKHANILSQNNINEMENLIKNNKEEMENMNNKMDSNQAEFDKINKELQEKENKLQKLINEKNSMTSNTQNENDKMSNLINEKTNQIQNLKSKLENLEKNSKNDLKNMRQKVDLAEKNKRQNERKFNEITSKFEKEKLLMEQKINFLEKNLKQINDQQNKGGLTHSYLHSNSAMLPLSSFINANNNGNNPSNNRNNTQDLNEIKEKISQYQIQTKQLNNELSKLQDKNIDLETQLLQKGKRIENEKAKIEEMLMDYEKKLDEIKSSNELLVSEIKNLKNLNQNDNNDIINEYEQQITDLELEQNELDDKFKTSENLLRTQLAKVKNELSLLKQNTEINEKKIEDMKSQIQNDKIEHDKYIKILEENNKKLLNQYETSVKDNNDLKNQQTNELTNIADDNTRKQEDLKKKNEELKEKMENLKAEYELKLEELNEKLENNEKKIIPEIKLKISELEIEIEDHKKEIEDTTKNNKNTLEEINFEYDNEIQDLLQKTREQIEDANTINERNIEEIRKCHELEKEEIDNKIKEDNDNTNSKLYEIETEQEGIYTKLEKEKNDQIDALQTNLDECDRIHDNYVNETDQDMALKIQQIESINKFLNDGNNNIQIIQNQQEETLKKQKERYEQEKNEFNNKINELKEENNNQVNEIKELENQFNDLTKTLNDLLDKLNESKNDLINNKNEYEEKEKEYSEKYNNVLNELNLIKANNQKDLSLKEQEAEFNNNKYEDYKNRLEEFKNSFDLKIQQTKDTIIKEFTEKIDNATKIKEDLEEQYNTLINNYNELNDKYQTDSDLLNKEKENIIEKLNKITNKKKELSETLEKEREQNELLMENIKNEFKAKNDILQKENETLQTKMKKIENDYQELNALYEKDSNIWQNKFQYLEEQKEMSKKELAELKNKYETNMDEIQKRILAERERLKNIYNNSISSREESYNSQIETLEKMFYEKYNEVNEQNKNLILENKALLKKIARYENKSLQDEVENKLTIEINNEKKLQNKLDEIVKKKDTKIEELKIRLNSEREGYQGKIADLERKIQEYEGKKNNLTSDIVKQKAVNEKDKENKINIIQNLKAKLMELQKINSKLLAENKDNLREKEQIKKSSRNSSLTHNSSAGYVPKYKMNSNYGNFNSYGNSNKENSKNLNNMQVVDKLNISNINKKNDLSSLRFSDDGENDKEEEIFDGDLE